MLNLALLAPVPEEHLVAGRECCLVNGSVAFGSRDFEVFRQLDAQLSGAPCDVLIYASWPLTPVSGPPAVTWIATYLRTVDARLDGSPPPGIFRPSSTEKYPGDSKGHWAVYWEVTHLAPLPKEAHLRVHTLRGLASSKRYLKTFRPERPLIISAP